MDNNRAESFLRLIRRSQRGKLKIYIGYAAGVGKTYQMLLEAHRLKEEGVDVVVGAVETHGRAETEALLAGLEVISRHKVTHHGIVVGEMDLEAIQARRPSVVLVDELAHTNVPGSKNAKRYQDVEEILEAGIHVVSAMNIQHLESLYETVERATSVKVRERVPDRIVAGADQLVNVDVTTEDLRQRLKEGKVYTHERIETAMGHFFLSANLEQLRELTLRELAAQIDSRRRDPLAEALPSSPDQIMVCLSSKGPNSSALLRYASRLAGRLNRNWYAVYVQTSQESPTLIDAATQRLLSNTLTLAQQLGATVFTYKGDDVAKAILQFAKEYRVGHIVIGSPGKPVPFWRRLMGEASILERLITEGREVTVVVPDTKAIAAEKTQGRDPLLRTRAAPASRAGDSEVERGESVLSNMPVLVWKESISKEAAMLQLLDACSLGKKEFRESAWAALQEREKLGCTFVGEAVTIPHARLAGLQRPVVALGVGRTGIEDCGSCCAAKIMLLLLSPAEPPESHVLMLGRLGKMASNDQWRKEIQSSGAASEVGDAIRKWEVRHNAVGDRI